MDADAILRLFRARREAEAVRDFDAILATFTAFSDLTAAAARLRAAGL